VQGVFYRNILYNIYCSLFFLPAAVSSIASLQVLTNCRFGCTVWALFPMCFAFKSYELYGFEASINMYVSLAILLVYLTKFFWWEAGYMCTIDIILDRAGFYICWGCLVWIPGEPIYGFPVGADCRLILMEISRGWHDGLVFIWMSVIDLGLPITITAMNTLSLPGLYTVFSFYLVSHPIALGYPKAAAILLAGLSCVTINYVADWQKQAVRANNGNCNIWGRKAEVIRAKFTTSKGEIGFFFLILTDARSTRNWPTECVYFTGCIFGADASTSSITLFRSQPL